MTYNEMTAEIDAITERIRRLSDNNPLATMIFSAHTAAVFAMASLRNMIEMAARMQLAEETADQAIASAAATEARRRPGKPATKKRRARA